MIDTALAVVGMLVAGAISLVVFAAGVMRAGRKGYQPGTLSVILIVGISAGFAGFVLIDGTSLHGGIKAVLATPCFLLTPSAALALLPRRTPRRIFSVRRVRFPYARIGRAIFVAACCAPVVLSALAWWTGGPLSLSDALGLLVIGPLLGLMVERLFTKILAQPVRAVPSFADALATDPRPPVVFMRAFDREGLAFVFDDNQKYGRYSTGLRFTSQAYVQISLDDYLKGPITRRIGQFLALGSPHDYFTPAGALRAYFKDQTWMDEFRELAHRAACLLIEVGESANLRWELQFLRQSNLHHKLIVVTGHPTDPYGKRRWIRMAARLAGIEPAPWDHFKATLTELGYQLPAGAPGLGSVIGFDADARAHVLTSGADLPDEFVKPMAAWLSGSRPH